jgi:hypothetical protein
MADKSTTIPIGICEDVPVQVANNCLILTDFEMPKEHMVYFPKNIDRKYGLNSIKNIETIKVGEIYCSRLKPKEEYEIVMVGTMPIKVKVT